MDKTLHQQMTAHIADFLNQRRDVRSVLVILDSADADADSYGVLWLRCGQEEEPPTVAEAVARILDSARAAVTRLLQGAVWISSGTSESTDANGSAR